MRVLEFAWGIAVLAALAAAAPMRHVPRGMQDVGQRKTNANNSRRLRRCLAAVDFVRGVLSRIILHEQHQLDRE